MLQGLGRLGEMALNALFPRRCLGCGSEGEYICPACIERLPRLTTDCPTHLGQPFSIDGVYAPFRFEGTVRRAVHELKYNRLRDISDTLASLMHRHIKEKRLDGDVLLPVPLHRKRMRQRGYNQSALLAKALGRLSGLPVDEGCLARSRATPAQAESAGIEERAANVAAAFVCRDRRFEGKKVILIDDVSTSGATLNACAAVLKRAGAAAVTGLTLAREV